MYSSVVFQLQLKYKPKMLIIAELSSPAHKDTDTYARTHD